MKHFIQLTNWATIRKSHFMCRGAFRAIAILTLLFMSRGVMPIFAETAEVDLAVSDIKLERINYAVGENPQSLSKSPTAVQVR